MAAQIVQVGEAARAAPDVLFVAEPESEECESFLTVDRFISKCRDRMKYLFQIFPNLTMMPGHFPAIMADDLGSALNEDEWPIECNIQGTTHTTRDGVEHRQKPRLYNTMQTHGVYTLEVEDPYNESMRGITPEDFHLKRISENNATQCPAFVDRRDWVVTEVDDAISQTMIPLIQPLIDENGIEIANRGTRDSPFLWLRINIETEKKTKRIQRFNSKVTTIIIPAKEKYVWIPGILKNNGLFQPYSVQWFTGHQNNGTLKWQTLLNRCDVKPFISLVGYNGYAWRRNLSIIEDLTAWMLGISSFRKAGEEFAEKELELNRKLIIEKAFKQFDQPYQIPLPKSTEEKQNLIEAVSKRMHKSGFDPDNKYTEIALEMTLNPNYIRNIIGKSRGPFRAIFLSINRSREERDLPALPEEMVFIILQHLNGMIYEYMKYRIRIKQLNSSGSMVPVWKLNI